MADTLDDSIRWDGQLRILAQRITEIFRASDADPIEIQQLAKHGNLDEVAARLGNTTASELQFLFSEIRAKAERLAERYPELLGE
jgi:hypothetical protein